MSIKTTLSRQELEFFNENGYLLKRNFVESKLLDEMQNVVLEHLNLRVPPFELEFEVDYPGSPTSINETGGDTIRRLKQAYARHPVFSMWAENDKVTDILRQLFQSNKLYLVQSHHNCIMTKQPQFSSETHWHKDTRYWNFENNLLINTWLPLGNECKDNGCLLVIPKTHQWQTPEEQLDKRLFLREDLEDNRKWIDGCHEVKLERGDLLFFHAALFHAAGKNLTTQSKNAVVFTYHSESNLPVPDSNSTNFDEIPLN